MTYKKLNSTSIKDANYYFKNGQYNNALSAYEEIAKGSGPLSKFVKFNIRQCEARLKPRYEFNLLNNNSIEKLNKLLFTKIEIKNLGALPHKNAIKKLLDSIYTLSLNEHHILGILECALSSPFQRDLLWYSANILSKNGFQIKKSNLQDNHISLINLILFATDFNYWLANRVKFRDWAQEKKIKNLRLWDLINQEPDPINKLHSQLPKYRDYKYNSYDWEKPILRQQSTLNKLRQRLTLGTILLNEKKFIGLNLLQHYEICDQWILVEGACQGYPTRKVTEHGLSRDNSEAQIRLFPDPLEKLKYIQHGWTNHTGEEAKSELRNRYLELVQSDFLIVIDADEFYLSHHLNIALRIFENENIFAVTLPQVHFWKNTSQFITGAYYDVSHIRVFRNVPGIRYIRNHNFPEIEGKFLHELGHHKFKRKINEIDKKGFTYTSPYCFHLGFTKDPDDMRDKNIYYINRGEALTRRVTTESRAAWFDDQLLDKHSIFSWAGPLPESLINEEQKS